MSAHAPVLQMKQTVPLIFNLAALGIHIEHFAAAMRPLFDQLEWDHYELRGRQAATLRDYLSAAPSHEQALADFLDITKPIEAFDIFNTMKPEVQSQLKALKPRRKRAASCFLLHKNQQKHWHIERAKNEVFIQTNSTFYPPQRTFPEINNAVAQNADFQTILQHLPRMVQLAGVNTNALKVTCHQVSQIASNNTPGHGSPEGIHQDGADFIVTALVVHREHVSGGKSRTYYKNEQGQYDLFSERILMPGEGMFHADKNTNIWHDVTPTKLEGDAAFGVRNTFGFDVEVVAGKK